MLRAVVVVVGMGLAVGLSPLLAIADAGSSSRLLTSPFSPSVAAQRVIHGDGTMVLARRSSSGLDRMSPSRSPQGADKIEEPPLGSKTSGVSDGPSESDGQPVQASARVQPSEDENAQALEQKIKSAENPFSYMEIEVSHSSHVFRLYGYLPSGDKKVLYECRVGLGGTGFPTPVGVYYVTHIYDQDPWWIPPKDRAWAAGQSPSKRVYGGTMAPLLKKRPVRTKKQPPEMEDMIGGEVQLDDYGYRFHGTNQPRSIGRNQSHGCVRMIPADAEKVAALIKRFVGEAERKESENGSFAVLKAPVRLNLVK
jgi:hypothetical protein